MKFRIGDFVEHISSGVSPTVRLVLETYTYDNNDCIVILYPKSHVKEDKKSVMFAEDYKLADNGYERWMKADYYCD